MALATAGGAPGTGASATTAAGAFSLLFLPDEIADNGDDNGQKKNGDKDGGKVGR